MAADLHIHTVSNGITQEDWKIFNSNCIGSKFFTGFGTKDERKDDALYTKFSNTDQVWVGEVSWLKAALMGDTEPYVPNSVMRISDIIGEDWPVIDLELIRNITEAMQLDNTTSYSLNSMEEVVAFLYANIGKECFTITW